MARALALGLILVFGIPAGVSKATGPTACTAAISAAVYPGGTETTIWYPEGCTHG